MFNKVRVRADTSKHVRIMAQSIPSVPIPPGAFVFLSVPAVGNLSENLFPGVGLLSILLEEVNVVSFLILHLKT